MSTKYPEVTVRLTGTEDNAFALIGRVQKALRGAGVRWPDRQAFVNEAIPSGYDQLLQTCTRWVNVELSNGWVTPEALSEEIEDQTPQMETAVAEHSMSSLECRTAEGSD